jgi:thiamine phosphate synthase YjbQ (UPF0047 family)
MAAINPTEITIGVTPRARFDIIDVRRRVLERHGTVLELFPQAIYCSFHTTAGYLDQSLASRLNTRPDGVTPYLRAFQTVFPEGAGYQHDKLHLRQELSEEQRRLEPRNGDSHLAFISAGLRTCVTYRHRPREPVYFIDLDGINAGCPRRRVISILGFSAEEVVARDRLGIAVTARSVDSVNLKDPCLGLFDQLEDLIARHGVTKGRIRVALAAGERQAALTINEYETLLMQQDLPDVIRNPFRFMPEQRRLLANPRGIRTRRRTIACARFFRLQRSISLLVSDCGTDGRGHLVQGRFQSPILLQWGPAEGRTRDIEVSLTRFR